MTAHQDPWDLVLEAVATIGDVERTREGFDARFVDAAGAERHVTVLMEPGAWDAWLEIIWGRDYDSASEEVLRMLWTSPPTTEALVATHDYQLLLVPYVPRL